MTNQPLTALDELLIEIAHKCTLKPTSVIKAGLKQYAAQTNAELVAENERLKIAVKAGEETIAYADKHRKKLAAKLKDTERILDAYAKKMFEHSDENERLKQQVKALIPLAAWGKKHGHELTCAIRKPMPEGVDKVSCTCGWVDAHNHSGLTTNQHIELANYSDTQPPKEAT